MFRFVLVALSLTSTLGLNSKVYSSKWKNAFASLAVGFGLAQSTHAAELPVYFGVGCFWHVQHEFVDAEKQILKRADNELTSLAGYAGGKATGNGKVCYHNLQGIAEYGDLGHGEVVNLKVPEETVGAFAQQYFDLFGADGDRPDKGDRGPEYRSLLGVPGGAASPYFKDIAEAATAKGIKLVEGKGNDADTLGKRMVWVMDSDKFPFYQAEVYHQFHDGFMLNEQYPQEYNSIRDAKVAEGVLKPTGCPERILF